MMRKGDARFLVGWMCGETIYGEHFEHYTADFDAAVNRQKTLRRRGEPALAWRIAALVAGSIRVRLVR